MKLMILTGYVLAAGVLLSACTLTAPETTSQTVEAQVPSATTTPEVADTVPDKLPVYSWLANGDQTSLYDGSNALAMRIPTPSGYWRTPVQEGSFAWWLRWLPLHPEDHPVYLYNGELKWNQRAHAAVLNIDVGTRDLQQCADAIMRLKAEYHYSQEEWSAIHFNFSDGTPARFSDWLAGNRLILRNDRWVLGQGNGPATSAYSNFRKYLNLVFGYAGTATLERELDHIGVQELQSGDIFIIGGHPGHAILVMDVAVNERGEKLFLLAQSYMPAQEIHLLVNPNDPSLSPWYQIPERSLATPEWTFTVEDLHRFANE
jgi:hypothetical protein